MTEPAGPRHPMVVLHRAQKNSFYAAAVSGLPGYLEAVALRTRAMDMQRAFRFPMVVYPEPPTTDSADLDAYLTAFTAAAEEEATRTRNADALAPVIGACERTINSVFDYADALRAALAADLADVMTRVGDVVTRLNGAATATESIDADTVDAWRELPPLRHEYDAIRAAQKLVGLDDPQPNHGSDHLDDPLASDAILRNLDELLPSWRDPDTRFTLQGAPPDRRPWPTDELEQLVWFVTSNAEVWLPTSAELAELHRERSARINPPLEGQPGNLMINDHARPWGNVARTAPIG